MEWLNVSTPHSNHAWLLSIQHSQPILIPPVKYWVELQPSLGWKYTGLHGSLKPGQPQVAISEAAQSWLPKMGGRGEERRGEERREGWRTGMSQQHQLAEWIVWTALPEEMSLLWLFSTKIPEAWQTLTCQPTHTLAHKVLLYLHRKLHSFSSHYHSPLSLLPVIFPGAQVPSLLGFHSTIYIYILNPQSLSKYYRLLHNPWTVRDTSDCICNHTSWLQVQQLLISVHTLPPYGLMVQCVCVQEQT